MSCWDSPCTCMHALLSEFEFRLWHLDQSGICTHRESAKVLLYVLLRCAQYAEALVLLYIITKCIVFLLFGRKLKSFCIRALSYVYTCALQIFTNSCGKVMFSQVSVNLLTGGGVGVPRRSASGRYPSYWNAFLFVLIVLLNSVVRKTKSFYSLPPTNEVLVKEGNVFTPACDSFCSRGGGGVPSRGCHEGRVPWRTPPPPAVGQQAGGTHPTGMHSSLNLLVLFRLILP